MQVISDFDVVLTSHRTLVKRFKCTLQPFVIAVGPPKELTAAYLVINDVKYLFTDLLKAVDACFKTFYALNASYPVSSEPIWIFIQKEIYGIEDSTKSYQNVESLRIKLKNIDAESSSDSDL